MRSVRIPLIKNRTRVMLWQQKCLTSDHERTATAKPRTVWYRKKKKIKKTANKYRRKPYVFEKHRGPDKASLETTRGRMRTTVRGREKEIIISQRVRVVDFFDRSGSSETFDTSWHAFEQGFGYTTDTKMYIRSKNTIEKYFTSTESECTRME